MRGCSAYIGTVNSADNSKKVITIRPHTDTECLQRLQLHDLLSFQQRPPTSILLDPTRRRDAMATPPATQPPPTKYGVVLFPGFQALDVFGPVDILNFLSKTRSLQLVVLAKDLDLVSTSFPAGGFGQSLAPTHSFTDAPDDIDVLLVPGGMGTRDDANIAPAVEYVKRAFPKVRFFLTVCTGSALAAKAGVLDDKRATTNKQAFKWVGTPVSGEKHHG